MNHKSYYVWCYVRELFMKLTCFFSNLSRYAEISRWNGCLTTKNFIGFFSSNNLFNSLGFSQWSISSSKMTSIKSCTYFQGIEKYKMYLSFAFKEVFWNIGLHNFCMSHFLNLKWTNVIGKSWTDIKYLSVPLFIMELIKWIMLTLWN